MDKYTEFMFKKCILLCQLMLLAIVSVKTQQF
jgi:hypothetical protein